MMERNKEEDLLTLAQACLLEMGVDEDFGYGLQQDGKRPFGNSGYRALIDTLEVVGVEFPEDKYGEDEMEEYIDYARELWKDLPQFIKEYCQLVLK